MDISKVGITPTINGELIYDKLSRIGFGYNGNILTLEIDFADETRKDSISIPFKDLTINGAAPASQNAAIVSLESLFPKATLTGGGNGSVDLSAYSTTEEMNIAIQQAVTTAIQNLTQA